MSADLALIDGKILTMNQSQPYAEAIAIKDTRIVHVGTNDEVASFIGKNTRVISLKGKTVVPGFIDTHIHVADFGRLLGWIDLSDVDSIKEVQERLGEYAEKSPKGKWLLGRGLNPTWLAEKRLPTRIDLDTFSPDNPVIFYQQTGQVCVVNSKALELAGLNRLTSIPPGVTMDRDEATGELTGVLRDEATNYIWDVIPQPSEEELFKAARLACEKIVETGITSVHWIVLSPIEIQIIQRLGKEKKLPLRIYVIFPMKLFESLVDSVSHKGLENDKVKLGGVEIAADGYLASRTAALFQPYSDDPGASGKLLCTQEEMIAAATKIVKAGLQVVIHAVGDNAIDAALNTIEEMLNKAQQKGLRNRIEQASVLNKKLINRMKKHEVIVSVQPCVIASEFSVWSALERLGPKRSRWLFPIKTLIKEGIRVIGGSDCPMEPLSPLLGMQTAVTREIFPEERVTIEEALRMFTFDAAYSSNEENVKGSIEKDKLADVVVLSHDLFSVPLSEIGGIPVELTIVGGRAVFSRNVS